VQSKQQAAPLLVAIDSLRACPYLSSVPCAFGLSPTEQRTRARRPCTQTLVAWL
jgi:hypothetical protein